MDSSRVERDNRKMSHSQRIRLLSIAVISMSLVMTGCAIPNETTQPAAVSSPGAESSAPEKVFDGTPDEYIALLRACYEDRGILTEDVAGSSGTFSIDNTAVSEEELMEVSDQCEGDLGKPAVSGLAETELRKRYDARVIQWTCLVDRGLVAGDAPSFDVFVDEYERSGQKKIWEPTETAAIEKDGRPVSPSDVCARPGDVW